MAHPKLTLTYFNVKGRAELPRMIFNYGGIAFTDERIGGAEFGALKATLPFKQLPVLKVDSTVYAQSMAIVRYAANLAGLYPSDAEQALKADMFAYSVAEVENTFVDFSSKTRDETVKAQKKKVFIEETLPNYLAALEKIVAVKFVVDDNLSFADLQWLDFVDNKVKREFPDFNLSKFPKLAAVLENVKAEPKIAAYLSK